MEKVNTKLAEAIGYTFKDVNLLKDALTLAAGSKRPSYERLEFLGDRVLGLVIAEMLYKQFPNEQEGDLSKRLAYLAKAETALIVANEIGLLDVLIIAHSEEKAIKANPTPYLCDCVEALIGAIYLDGGLAPAKQFIVDKFTHLMKACEKPPLDAKTTLQEWAQTRGYGLPIYEVEEISGEDHARLFKISVKVGDFSKVIGQGTSKKNAEKNAANLFLQQVKG